MSWYSTIHTLGYCCTNEFEIKVYVYEDKRDSVKCKIAALHLLKYNNLVNLLSIDRGTVVQQMS